MKKVIWFDMDGTIVDLYGFNGWLECILARDVRPYVEAGTLVNLSLLARYIHKLQGQGWKFGIASWTSKSGTELYNGEIAISKLDWLYRRIHSVSWDYIKILPYGTNKYEACGGGILFDDEVGNRNDWKDKAYGPENIFTVLKGLVNNVD